MHLKRLLLPLATLLVLFIGYRGASAFMVAKAIVPPHASRASILRLAIHPSFQMATPHRTLFQELKLTLVPSVQACSPPNCTGEESQVTCYAPCPQDGNCYYCPSCTLTPGCTPRQCTYTGIMTYICHSQNGTAPCTTCPNDYSDHQCTKPPNYP